MAGPVLYPGENTSVAKAESLSLLLFYVMDVCVWLGLVVSACLACCCPRNRNGQNFLSYLCCPTPLRRSSARLLAKVRGRRRLDSTSSGRCAVAEEYAPPPSARVLCTLAPATPLACARVRSPSPR